MDQTQTTASVMMVHLRPIEREFGVGTACPRAGRTQRARSTEITTMVQIPAVIDMTGSALTILHNMFAATFHHFIGIYYEVVHEVRINEGSYKTNSFCYSVHSDSRITMIFVDQIGKECDR